jgi:hypothetical protein
MNDIRIERGTPDDTEVAALLAAIVGLGTADAPAVTPRRRPAPWHRPARYRAPGAGNELWSR